MRFGAKPRALEFVGNSRERGPRSPPWVAQGFDPPSPSTLPHGKARKPSRTVGFAEPRSRGRGARRTGVPWRAARGGGGLGRSGGARERGLPERAERASDAGRTTGGRGASGYGAAHGRDGRAWRADGETGGTAAARAHAGLCGRDAGRGRGTGGRGKTARGGRYGAHGGGNAGGRRGGRGVTPAVIAPSHTGLCRVSRLTASSGARGGAGNGRARRQKKNARGAGRENPPTARARGERRGRNAKPSYMRANARAERRFVTKRRRNRV